MTFFDTRLGKLDELLADGTSFGQIEDWIEDQPIDAESKAPVVRPVRATARAASRNGRPGRHGPCGPRHPRRPQPGPA